MARAAEQPNGDVVDFVEYLRQTIADVDEAMVAWSERRREMAVRVAAIEAADDPKLADAAADYQARVADSRPYEGAEDAERLLAEAHRRFGS